MLTKFLFWFMVGLVVVSACTLAYLTWLLFIDPIRQNRWERRYTPRRFRD